MNITKSTAANNATVRNWSVPGEGKPAATKPGNELATKDVFLQLLVAQIKNQNPLNPMDGTEFLGQLSQFTQVEQTLGMREDLAAILGVLKANGAAAGPPPG